ncbi:MAG: acyltransferase, partial [Candidatus Aminicenantes bacterium]|nr:acyltransferase [Candidatus Aminicenantes bacterium]
MIWKIRKKFFKYMSRFALTNGMRICFLRAAGYRIGSDVYIGESFIISDTLRNRDNVVIGDRVSIAPRVTIITDSSPNNSVLKSLYPLETKKVTINDDAWLGAGAIILPGVEIGKCA